MPETGSFECPNCYEESFPDEVGTVICGECGAADVSRRDAREGMVTVYDHEGNYVGCMGVETWYAALAAARPDAPQEGS